jgi:hypothetical protein
MCDLTDPAVARLSEAITLFRAAQLNRTVAWAPKAAQQGWLPRPRNLTGSKRGCVACDKFLPHEPRIAARLGQYGH